MLLIDIETCNVVDANEAACAFYGWSAEQIKRKKIWDINTLGEQEVRKRINMAALRKNQHFQFRHRVSSGEERDVSVASSLVRLGGKDLLFSYITDITDRQRQEKTNKRFAEFERTILHFAEHFINTPLDRLDESIHNALVQVSDFLSADHITVWRYDWSNDRLNLAYAERNGNEPFRSETSLPVDKTCVVANSHLQGKIHRVDRPAVWTADDPFELIWKAGVESYISIPLTMDDAVLGMLNIATCKQGKQYTEQEVSTAKIFAEMLASVLNRIEREEAINKSNEILRLMFDSTSDAVVMLDRNLRVADVNASFEQIIGKKKQELVGLRLPEILPQSVVGNLFERRMEVLQKVLQTGESVSIEEEFEKLIFVVNLYPIYKDSQIIGLKTSFFDVTRQRRAERESRRHEAFKNAILHLSQNFINMPLDQMEDGIDRSLALVADYCGASNTAIWMYDYENEVCRISHAFDRSPQESIKGYCLRYDLFPGIWQQLLQGGTYYFDRDKEETDGKLMLRTSCKSAWIIPLREGGHLEGLFSIAIRDEDKAQADMDMALLKIFAEMLKNVLKRKEKTTALAESRRKYQLIIDSTNDSIAMFNDKGDVMSLNTRFEERFRKGKAELIGKSLAQILPEHIYGNLSKERTEHILSVFKTKRADCFEDSRDHYVFENRVYPVFDEQQNVTAAVLFSTDVTYRKKAEEEAKSKAEYQARLKATTDFFTNISHELKTPLSVLLMQLEIMEMCLDDHEQMVKLIKTATQNSYRLFRLVSNLLDITKIDSGYMITRLEITDVKALCDEICDSVQSYAHAKNLTLHVQNRLHASYVPTDKEKLERILFNLLSNAIKHSNKGGEIIVSIADGRRDELILSVEDKGEGIPQDKLEAIFDRFVQVDSSTCRQNEGSGIGLALVKSLVELLGGSIAVKSKLGVGSKFTVRLPNMNQALESACIKIDSYDIRKKADMELSDLYLWY